MQALRIRIYLALHPYNGHIRNVLAFAIVSCVPVKPREPSFISVIANNSYKTAEDEYYPAMNYP